MLFEVLQQVLVVVAISSLRLLFIGPFGLAFIVHYLFKVARCLNFFVVLNLRPLHGSKSDFLGELFLCGGELVEWDWVFGFG
jgi:hypothetical protein